MSMTNSATRKAIIRVMGNDLLDTTGARLQWLRKRKGITQQGLAHVVGVHHVYISQLESNTRTASRSLIAMLANELETSIGFLELETDDPTPPKRVEPEPIYFSPEADNVARMIDAMPEQRRAFVLNLVRLCASHGEMLDAGRPATGVQGADLVLREIIEGIAKRGSA